MNTYGIYSDEGLLEGEFLSRAEAVAAMAADYSEDGAHVAEQCHEHREQERHSCEVCHNEGEGSSAKHESGGNPRVSRNARDVTLKSRIKRLVGPGRGRA